MSKEFIYELTVFLGDVNIYGSTYFAKYFEWQGKARESFFKYLLPEFSKIASSVKLITIEASMSYKKDSFLFEDILIKIAVENIKATTFGLQFTFLNKKLAEIISTGKQKIGFTDMENKVIPIPLELKEAWLKFTEDK